MRVPDDAIAREATPGAPRVDREGSAGAGARRAVRRGLPRAFAAFAGAVLLLFGAARADVTALVNANVIYPERDAAAALVPDTTLIVEGERIRAVGPSATTSIPAGAHVIDARGKWIVPGLVDAHVHFDQSGNLYARPDVADLTAWMPYARESARNRARLPETFRAWLRSGVTGVVDIGGPKWTFEVRALARRTPAAPRMAAAGPLVSMIARPQLDLGDPPIVQVTSAGEARALVARTLRFQPDYIKVWFIHQPGDDLAQQEAIVKAAGKAAHAAGVRFAVHATELDVAKAALRAGADYLVHSVEDAPVDEEFLALARERNVLYCPTLFVYEGYGLALTDRWQATEAEQRLADSEVLAMMDDLDIIPPDMLPPWLRRAIERGPGPSRSAHAQANLKRVWDEGIAVVVGSDAGNIGTLHGAAIFREMERMVQAGLTPLEVLRAATTHGAKALATAPQTGVLAPGALADLVVLDANPLADIGNLSRIHTVLKGGRSFTPAELGARME
jgi:imidazolonepropionase-like amidohydrolase